MQIIECLSEVVMQKIECLSEVVMQIIECLSEVALQIIECLYFGCLSGEILAYGQSNAYIS